MGTTGIGSLLNIARGSLGANSQAIRVIGNNIANVNTPGYSRRTTNLTSRDATEASELAFGNGVEISGVTRSIDEFFNKEYLARIGDRSRNEARDGILGRAETSFALDGGAGTIGYELNGFFSALSDLATNPSSLDLRNAVISQGQALTNSINNTYNSIADLQREADTRIEAQVGEVNRLTTKIADLNRQVLATEPNDQENLGVRDSRDEAVRELTGLISVNVVEDSTGVLNVSLGDGSSLVSGTSSRQLEFTRNPDFAPVGGYPAGLDGNALGFIVYDYDPNAAGGQVNLTDVVAGGGGEIGGLLATRGIQASTDTTAFDAVGDLPEIASMVEAIARDLLTNFNQMYMGDINGSGTITAADDESPLTAVINASAGGLNNATPGAFGMFSFTGATDSDGDGLAESSDLNTIGLPSYAARLTFNISDARALAAGFDQDATAGVVSIAPGDARNIDNLLALRTSSRVFSAGNYSQTTTIDQVYNNAVSEVGTRKAAAARDLAIDTDREAQVKELVSSVSGVNLDEEFANLISFQRAFEGSARLVRVGDELLQEIISIAG